MATNAVISIEGWPDIYVYSDTNDYSYVYDLKDFIRKSDDKPWRGRLNWNIVSANIAGLILSDDVKTSLASQIIDDTLDRVVNRYEIKPNHNNYENKDMDSLSVIEVWLNGEMVNFKNYDDE